ncbi:ABC transporter permease [Spirulina subsalsa FACHB-351]|uniref:ABC transporter permease n=1 Tax=Spirulina subsalsa FACHB-351 TaxID=234711 RepID=A0ABT3L5W3_9CYAN|nr:ABC transporter permease [Spirulina subsalsa]MCW6036892.1 ABC transporter permease [Spirulina subsalsa FACHB-351]
MIIIANIFAIFRKELQSYFASPLAYIVAGVFWLLSGLFFWELLLSPTGLVQEVQAGDATGLITGSTDVAYIFLIQFLSVIGSLISPIILPMLSMGLYAEERKNHTLELIATSPLTNWVVAVGKLCGVLTFYTVLLVPLFIYQIIAFSTASPPVPPAVPLLANLGLILLAASILSLGMFISSLTSSSMIAALVTFFIVFLFISLHFISGQISEPFGSILRYLSPVQHYDNFVRGIFETSSLFVFLSYIILGIFLTAQSIETLRFNRS